MRRGALTVSVAALCVLPASAAADPSGCPDGSYCFWSKQNYEGKRVVISKSGISNKLFNEMNKRASSMKNRRSDYVIIYTQKNGSGFSACFAGPNLSNLAEFDNDGSSSRAGAGACPMMKARGR